MRVEMKPRMQRKVNRYGSVLKAFRTQGRTGDILLLVLGIYFIFCGALMLLGVLFEPEESIVWWIASAVLVGAPGLVMLLIRVIMRVSRIRNYLSYYQKQTGYSVEELQEADRELMGYSAVKIGEMIHYYAKKPELMYIITEHYLLSVGSVKGSYLIKLEDIVAAFYSCQIPQRILAMQHEGLFIISRQDIHKKPFKNRTTKRWYRGFDSGMMASVKNCDKLCAEILEEMRKRAPYIIPYQNIMWNGAVYNLLSLENWQVDWARILGQ